MFTLAFRTSLNNFYYNLSDTKEAGAILRSFVYQHPMHPESYSASLILLSDFYSRHTLVY